MRVFKHFILALFVLATAQAQTTTAPETGETTELATDMNGASEAAMTATAVTLVAIMVFNN